MFVYFVCGVIVGLLFYKFCGVDWFVELVILLFGVWYWCQFDIMDQCWIVFGVEQFFGEELDWCQQWGFVVEYDVDVVFSIY